MGGWFLTSEREGRRRLGCLHLEGWLEYELDDQKDYFNCLLEIIYISLYTIGEGASLREIR